MSAASPAGSGSGTGRTGSSGRIARPRPLPAIEVEIGPMVPALLLRVVIALLVVGCGAVIAPSPGWVAAVVLAAAVPAVMPHVAVAGAVLAAGGLLMMVGEPSPAGSVVMTLGGHLLLTLTRWAGAVPPIGHVELALMVRTAPTFAVVQLVAQAMVALAWLADGAVEKTGWFAVLALAALLAATLAGLRALRSREVERS